MTLIAAWITPEFRIVASDSRLTNKHGISINENCQKVFANNSLAVGLFGSSFEKERSFLKSFFQNYQDADINEFKNIFESDSFNNIIHRNSLQLVVITKNNLPEIWLHNIGEKLIFIDLEEYKKLNQPSLPSHLFFSEQILPNSNIDFQHQENLTKQFEKSKQLTEFDNNNITDESLEKLFQDFYSAVYYEGELQKEVIGGDKIYLAYCFKNENWRQIELKPIPFTNYKEQRAFDDMKQIFGF